MRALFRLSDRGVAALTGEVHFFVALGDAKVHTLLMGQSNTEGGAMSEAIVNAMVETACEGLVVSAARRNHLRLAAEAGVGAEALRREAQAKRVVSLVRAQRRLAR